MHIIYKKKFDKQLDKMNTFVKKKFIETIKIFTNDKYDRVLNNHALKGTYAGLRSINVTGDIRALYYEEGDEIVIFALIGSHSQLY